MVTIKVFTDVLADITTDVTADITIKAIASKLEYHFRGLDTN